MRTSDQQYFRSCVAQERHLAQLLGYCNIEEYSENAGTLTERRNALPKWTRDWRACGPLLAKYDLDIHFVHDAAHGQDLIISVGAINVHCSDHPNKERALMFAIVKAVIFLLEHSHHRPSARHGAHLSERRPH